MRTALYKHFDCKGRLLYVGISSRPLERTRQHIDNSTWASLVSSITICNYASRPAALAAESEAIVKETPLFNIVHNSGNAKRKRRRGVLASPSEAPDVRPPVDDIRATSPNEIGYLVRAARAYPVLVDTLRACRERLVEDNYTESDGVVAAIDSALSLAS